MAATGYTPIILFNSTSVGAQPTTGNLAVGELALNIPDGKLYYNKSGTITVLANANTVAPVTTLSFGTTGLTPSTATSGAITVAGTLATTNGGTGLTSFTANGLVYASSTSALATGSVLTFDGTNFTSGKHWITVNGTTTTQYLNFGDGTTPFAQIGGYYDSSTTGHLEFYTATGGTSTERMRITNAGLVLVNATSGTALLTLGASTTYPALKVPNIVETANTVAGAPASTQTFYLGSGAVQYYTSNAANNWTVNFAMSAGTSMNTAMAVGDSVSVTMLTTQGSTAYYNSAVQVDGTSSGVTTKWQGGTAPTSGNASSIDSYTYVIYKTASATYTVLASQTKFA